MCVQEKEMLVMEMNEDVIMANVGKRIIFKDKPISYVCYESNIVRLITLGGLILVLQSMSLISSRVLQA
jgi:hypothetical protein